MAGSPITFGSLFAGGGGLDMGLESAGMKCVFQVENDKHCLTVLRRHFPDCVRNSVRPCVGLVGGDPCPIRSVGSNIHGTSAPDLSGYFLAMVARCKPQWVLRENVPAPDVVEYAAGLEVLGYRTVVVATDSAAVTGARRKREWVVGFNQQNTFDRFTRACTDASRCARSSKAEHSAKDRRLGTPLHCVTTRRHRMDLRDTLVYEGPDRGIRVLSHEEREQLQGWPTGWTDSVPTTARERIVGNGVTAPVAEWLGRRIIEATP